MCWLQKICTNGGFLDPKWVDGATLIKQCAPEIMARVQQEYDAWDQSGEYGDGDLGFGGICQNFAEIVAEILNMKGYETSTVSSTMGEQHVYAVTKMHDGVYEVDIPYWMYERGGGYNWTKIDGVRFSPNDLQITRLSPDPEQYPEFVEDF